MRVAIFEAIIEGLGRSDNRLIGFSGNCAIPGRIISLGLIRWVAPLRMMSSVLRQVLPIVVAGIDADATVLVAAAFLFSSLVVDSPNFSLVLALAAIARASRLLVFDSIRVGAPMSIVSDVWLIVKRFVNMGMLD